jgi:hypothetical protein
VPLIALTTARVVGGHPLRLLGDRVAKRLDDLGGAGHNNRCRQVPRVLRGVFANI